MSASVNVVGQGEQLLYCRRRAPASGCHCSGQPGSVSIPVLRGPLSRLWSRESSWKARSSARKPIRRVSLNFGENVLKILDVEIKQLPCAKSPGA